MGDSTMRQHHAMLTNRIVWQPRGTTEPARVTPLARLRECAAQISFVLSDTLTMQPLGRMNRGYPIRKVLARGQPAATRWQPAYDVAIVSAGSHVTNDTNFMCLLDYVATTVAAAFPQTKLLWKLQNPAGCSVNDQPLTSFPDEAFFDAQVPSSYNWPSFARRDQWARSAFRHNVRLPQIGGLVDFTPTNLRADAHISSPGSKGQPNMNRVSGSGRDCLHLCHAADGGPLGLGPQLLLHALETGQISFDLPPQLQGKVEFGSIQNSSTTSELLAKLGGVQAGTCTQAKLARLDTLLRD